MYFLHMSRHSEHLSWLVCVCDTIWTFLTIENRRTRTNCKQTNITVTWSTPLHLILLCLSLPQWYPPIPFHIRYYCSPPFLFYPLIPASSPFPSLARDLIVTACGTLAVTTTLSPLPSPLSTFTLCAPAPMLRTHWKISGSDSVWASPRERTLRLFPACALGSIMNCVRCVRQLRGRHWLTAAGRSWPRRVRNFCVRTCTFRKWRRVAT